VNFAADLKPGPSYGFMLIWTIELLPGLETKDCTKGYSAIPKLFGDAGNQRMDVSSRSPATSRWNPALKPFFAATEHLFELGEIKVPRSLTNTWTPISRDLLPIPKKGFPTRDKGLVTFDKVLQMTC
jgi:hypothetical protein